MRAIRLLIRLFPSGRVSTTNARQLTVPLCVLLLLWAAFPHPAAAQAQGGVTPENKLKAALIEIPTGSIVELRLKDKQKLRGKLGSLSDTDVQLQTLQSGKIETRSIAFDQVKSIKVHGKGMGTAAKVTLGVLAGIGTFIVIVAIVAAAHGWDS